MMGSTLNNTRSSLFLIELIIAILFFSLGAAVCVQAFVKAHTTSAEAQDLSFASTTVSSAANVVKYTDGSLDAVRTYFPNAYADGEDIAIGYGSDLTPCDDPAGTVYTLRIASGSDGSARTARIHMDGADGHVIYELELRYPGEKGVS